MPIIARTLVLALVSAVLVVVVSISESGHSVAPTTSFATTNVAWADLDCSGGVTTADPLQVLLEMGGLPGDGAEFCPIVGSPVEADGVARVFGDVNCDDKADGPDVVELLLDLAGIGATTGACPGVGDPVDLTLLATVFEIGDDWRDYGDAPEGAPTLYTGGALTGSFPTSEVAGPSHETPFAFRLGEFETAEEVPRDDDSADDGLLWLEMTECATSSALVAISLGGLSEVERDTPLTVNIFADWNKDGDWDDTDGCTDEWALQNFGLDVSGEPDFTILTVDFPGGEQVDEFWMRVMLTDRDYNPATDNLVPGETEDYLITGGQVFLPDDSEQTSALAQPLGGKKAGNQFLCRGSVVPHGSKEIIFQFEQTIASFGSGFRVGNIKTRLSQPTMEDGKDAADVALGRTAWTLTRLDKNGQVEDDPTKDGRINLQLTVEITTTKDTPDRVEGPFVIDVSISGRQRDGKKEKFSGSQDCVFYVDHSAGADEQVGVDGFFGGPGRAAATGKVDPKFVFVQHGKTIVLQSDALILNCAGLTGAEKTACQQEVTGSRYDKSSVTVFGSDGAVIAPADLKTKAGIKSVKAATNRRVIKIKTVKDNHDPPVERIVIRVKGKRPGGAPFWDYFRVVIIHERGSKAKKLATEFMESSVAFFFEEDEATTIAYVGDGQSLIEHEAPFGLATFDDTEVICVAGSAEQVRHPFHSSFEVSSWGFIRDYGGGQGSDVYFIPPSNQARSVSGGLNCPPPPAVNVTDFGPNSGFDILEATGCGDKVLFSELNLESGTFRLGAVGHDGSGLAPVAEGESVRDMSCVTYDHTTGIGGSTPDPEGGSSGVFLGLLPCNATCTQSPLAPKVVIPADGPDVHIVGLAVSPDATKIAWYRTAPGESQIWVGDFDPFTQTVSNHQQLTTEGLNYDPTWSPDGSQVAFFSDRDGNFEIYVMNADGSDQTNITNTPNVAETEPSWQVP